MRDADDVGLLDRRVLAQRALDLGRVGVGAADDEHVALAAGDREVAVGVEHAEVAGVEPAVGVDHRRRRLGVLVVALHHEVAADADLALGARRRAPRRVSVSTTLSSKSDDREARPEATTSRRVVEPRDRRDRGRLGHAVDRQDALHPELVDDRLRSPRAGCWRRRSSRSAASETSRSSSAAWLRRSMKCVGMPLKHGHALALDQLEAPRAGSQRSIRIIAPPVISGGSTPVKRAGDVEERHVVHHAAVRRRCPSPRRSSTRCAARGCECTAPFG